MLRYLLWQIARSSSNGGIVMAAEDKRPYRKCVGVMLVNRDDKVFVGDRIDTEEENWQMPQGGVDKGETLKAAASRELLEETGTDKAEFIGEVPHWIHYDLPIDISKRVWGGRYRGQKQRWFAMRFLGEDADIRLYLHIPEFSAWRWVSVAAVCDMIIPFKRPVYAEVVEAFSPLFSRRD